MNKFFRLTVVFFMITAMFAAAFFSSDMSASAQASGFNWTAVIKLSADQQGYARSTSAALSDVLQAREVTVGLTDTGLKLTGSHGIEQLRSALFDDTADWVDFLGGPVRLTLRLPASNVPVTLRLESRLTAGYSWEVVDPSQVSASQVGESSVEMRYRGYGAPAIQTIQLPAAGPNGATVQLMYQRPFEKNQSLHASVTISLPEGSTLVELSDPTPTERSADVSDPTTQNDNPYAGLQPKALPASWDWRTQGIVPAVRDQGSCGGCWAFGTVGVMESAIKKGGGPLTDLSEQFLISCNNHGWDCGGGLTASMYHFNTLGKSQAVAGAVLESAKPYTATNGSCTVSLAHPYKASGWQFITPGQDEFVVPTDAEIKNAIYTYGPITAGVCVGPYFEAYTPGTVFSRSESCGGYTNHQIILVGWDANGWILRNSWGPYWGNNGYMNIAYGTSRVGEGTSWVKYVAPVTAPLTYNPKGDTYTADPTFSWASTGAASYKLKVKDVAAGTYPINGLVISNSFCNPTTKVCSYKPAVTFTYEKSYQWQVAAGSGAYSALKAFKPVAGFNSQFNGVSTGWVKRPGGAWATTSATYYTNGAANLLSSASYNRSFTNFTMQARMRRVSASTYASGLVVRGAPVFGSDNDWLTSYQFLYRQDGTFSVWKGVGGSWTALKGWTTSAAIVKNGWNILKVTADDSKMRFYMNGVLVWTGADSAIKSGQVAFWMERGATVEKLEVDWATLGMSDLYKASGKLESGQVEVTTQVDRLVPVQP